MTHFSLLLLYLLIGTVATFIFIPPYIRILYRYNIGKKIREEGLIGKATEFAKLHASKIGTPTMWWGIILIVILLLVLGSIVLQKFASELWLTIRYSLWNRNETYLALFTLFAVGSIGIVDDFLNVKEIGRTKGLSARVKLTFLFLFAGIGAWWFFSKLQFDSVSLPWIGDVYLGYFYIPLFILIVATMANSVNFTDGLDGLAWGILLMNFWLYAFICYDKWLTILAALCLIIAGSLISFLWFNIKPAMFYMGDTWSLSLGATLAVIAMMTDTLAVLFVSSAIFWLELLSVVIQLLSKKLRNGKKVFRIAPFHHHLEAIGWTEETIVMKFWLISIVLVALWGVISQII
jgi:phospho-N-acetylmuramoyl-pentapeptide-transferase